jgi:altronate dehydratase large subunit
MSGLLTTRAFVRSDGRKGIRNTIAVVYLVECAHHVAREIAFPHREHDVHLLGFGGCYPNDYAFRMLRQICTHPNVGAVLLVSLGCEGFDRGGLLGAVRATGRPCALLVIQENRGTRRTIADGRAWVAATLEDLANVPRGPMSLHELVVGTVSGGSDGTSGLTANPSVGTAFDRLVGAGATCIFEGTGEMIGCDRFLADRATSPVLGGRLAAAVDKAARYYATLGHGSFAPGNADGGLTTQEEKSMGAYAKSGTVPVSGLIKPGEQPPGNGLYLLDIVPDGEVRFGFPNINDIVEIAELIACGAHVILFATARGSVVGSAVSPVIKVCANPDTFRNLPEDMDIDAGRVLEGRGTLEDVADEIVTLTAAVAAGQRTASETLGHQEFVLGYKTFEPAGPACHPSRL